MGSKHNPPRWWLDYDRTCAAWSAHQHHIAGSAQRWAEYAAMTDPTFSIDVHKILVSDPPAVTWECWVDVGSQCLTSDGDPITPNMVTHIGMEIIAATLFGYVRAVIQAEDYAESEHLIIALEYHPTRGLVSSSTINKRALHKLELMP